MNEGEKLTLSNKDIVVKPSDIYTFCFTSGTTGPPKGALIRHSNNVAGATGFIIHKDFRFNSDDVHLSYLPLPHLMERSIANALFFVGGKVVYF